MTYQTRPQMPSRFLQCLSCQGQDRSQSLLLERPAIHKQCMKSTTKFRWDLYFVWIDLIEDLQHIEYTLFQLIKGHGLLITVFPTEQHVCLPPLWAESGTGVSRRPPVQAGACWSCVGPPERRGNAQSHYSGSRGGEELANPRKPVGHLSTKQTT